jgi:NAD(P)-dependent dehydrogenase (short-subunit alcohol dehydrogenase family)
VYIAARSSIKAEEAIKELKTGTGKLALFLKLDLADLKSVKRAAEEFLSKESQLHVLFNSGGVMFPPVEQLTADGYDLQFGTNVLGMLQT